MKRGTRRLCQWLVVPWFAIAGCGDGEPAEADDEPPRADDAATVVAATIPPEVAASLPGDVSVAMISEGKELFGRGCVACHGVTGEGTQLGPSLRDTIWIHSASDAAGITAVIRSGVAEPREFPVPMPPSGGLELDDAELRALGAYVSVLHHGVL